MDGLGLQAGGLGEPLGRTSGRGAQQDVELFGREDLQDAVDQGRLAGARAAGDDERFAGKAPGGPRPAGTRRASSPVFPSTQGSAFSASILPHGGAPCSIRLMLFGHPDFRPVKRGQEQAGYAVDLFRHQVFLGDLLPDRFFQDSARQSPAA